MKRKTRRKYRASPKLMAEIARKKAKMERIKALIRRIDELMSRTFGPRYFTYKLRRNQAERAIKAIKGSMREKPKRSGRIPYVVNTKGVQGGAPGLVQQK